MEKQIARLKDKDLYERFEDIVVPPCMKEQGKSVKNVLYLTMHPTRTGYAY